METTLNHKRVKKIHLRTLRYLTSSTALAILVACGGAASSDPANVSSVQKPQDRDRAAAAATVSLSIDGDTNATWAALDIRYFKLRCSWSDGFTGAAGSNNCDRAGYAAPSWSTAWAWFEPIKTGTARIDMTPATGSSRLSSMSGIEVSWNTPFDPNNDHLQTPVNVSYAGSTAQVKVDVWKGASAARTDGGLPLPCSYALYSEFGCMNKDTAIAWSTNTPLEKPEYINAQFAKADSASAALESFIKSWAAGNRSPKLVPAELTNSAGKIPKSLSGGRLRYKLVKPEEADMTAFWIARPARFNHDVNVDGAQALYPDYNVTYLRAEYMAPYGSKIVFKGQYPRSRFFDIQSSQPFDPVYPAGRAFGAPEVPIVDVDINPDADGSVNPFKPGANRNATQRNYAVTYLHQKSAVTGGGAVTLNENRAPGSMTEITPAGKTYQAAYRPVNNDLTNTRIGGGMRSGGGTAPILNSRGRVIDDSDLLPAQVWIRYYAPDKPAAGQAFDPLGGVALPKVSMYLSDGTPFMLVPLRYPETADGYNAGELRDRALRRINAALPANDLVKPIYSADMMTQWGESVGWIKMFGIGRTLFTKAAIEKDSLFASRSVNTVDAGNYGRGPTKPLTGGLENSATSAAYVNYLNRSIAIEPGKVAVLIGRMPSFPNTRNRAATMPNTSQIRYLSLTRYEIKDDSDPGKVFFGLGLGTLMDDEIQVPTFGVNAGWYMIAMSRSQDRPSKATAANGVTWVNWGDWPKQGVTARWLSVGPESYDAALAPDGNNMPYEKADWAASSFDRKLSFTNDRAVAKQKDYFMQVHYMTKASFDALNVTNTNWKNLSAGKDANWGD
jgi:hypothetical protein